MTKIESEVKRFNENIYAVTLHRLFSMLSALFMLPLIAYLLMQVHVQIKTNTDVIIEYGNRLTALETSHSRRWGESYGKPYH